MKNTIYALSTPFSRSAIAIVRISGFNALDSINKLTNIENIKPFKPKLCILYDFDKKIIDKPLVIYFPKDKSYTGENLVEFHVHGSIAVIKNLLELLSRIPGYRLAFPGEFTKRALENNKIDLIAAEGIYDLINSDTINQKNQAIRALNGDIKIKYQEILNFLKEKLALIETTLDFADEDIPDNLLTNIDDEINNLYQQLISELSNYRGIKKLKQGIELTILGIPNVGKSSLINYLSGKEIAITSNIAGTTRDVIASHLDVFGYPVVLNDTAGINNETIDVIEREGVRRALKTAQASDIKIIMLDAVNLKTSFSKIKEFISEGDIILINKIDLTLKPFNNLIKEVSALIEKRKADVLMISIQKQINLSLLKDCLKQKLEELTKINESPLILNERHNELLNNIKVNLEDFLNNHDIIIKAYQLRSSINYMGQVLGLNNIEDILDIIFSKFCIGK